MMKTNILEFLEETAIKYPEKTAFTDGTYGITFSEFSARAKSAGTFLAEKGFYAEPVVVFMEKHPDTINAFMSVLYAGCFYIPIDAEMPRRRIDLILENLQPRAIICSQGTREEAQGLWEGAEVWEFSEMIGHAADEECLAGIRSRQLDTDPIYVVFTSGSTGVPKGVVACHRSVIDYAEQLTEVLGVDDTCVFGMQSPLYFDACLKEICSVFWHGATTVLVPKELFMQPVALVKFLNEQGVTNICWVVSALTLISGLGTFREVVPETLRTVAFGSEVFPIKQFQRWKKAVPGARFINLYGPTECTGMSCWYEVDREFEEGEAIPIGRPFRNTGLFLLDDDDKEAQDGEPGEICIRGTPVTLGYYNDPVRTAEAFTQNPLNTRYPELIYRTGDIAKKNERGELVFISRKDYQIKHMGHRIELGEIELAAGAHDEVATAACVFDDKKKKIVLCYSGTVSPAELAEFLRSRLPVYMMPSHTFLLDRLPQTANGKLDRKTILAKYLGGEFK